MFGCVVACLDNIIKILAARGLGIGNSVVS